MKRIRLLTSLCGNKLGPKGENLGTFGYREGAVISWPKAEADRMIARGFAEEAPDEK